MAGAAQTHPTREAKRKQREDDLIAVTRRLFDERGMQDAPIEEIAREAGIARGLIYRQFSSKEELFVVTVVSYLSELGKELDAARTGEGGPPADLDRLARAFGEFCVRYPAFLDCALSLMRQSADALNEIVSEVHYFRLGRHMGRCIDTVGGVLRDGVESGDFDIEDPDYVANFLWTQMLGAMHLTRIGLGVRQVASGVPDLFPIESDRVVQTCIDCAQAFVAAR